MLYKATALDGERLEFHIGDCPSRIGANLGALTGIPNSKLFVHDTIVRGFDAGNGVHIYEGDIIVDKATDKELGVVTYAGGFAYQDRQGHRKPIDITGHIYVKEGTDSTIDFVCNEVERSDIKFKHGREVFHLKDFVCKVNDVVVLSSTSEPIMQNNIKSFTGLQIDDTLLFIGDYFDGGDVVLNESGQLCIYKSKTKQKTILN